MNQLSRGDHLRVTPGTLIQDRYKVLKEVGYGNFSKVYACEDLQTDSSSSPRRVAIKIVKREYSNDARFEHDIMRVLQSHDPQQHQSILFQHDFFFWRNFPCFVLPLKCKSLKECSLGVGKGNVSRQDFCQWAYQMLQAVNFLHNKVKLIHTDLKPENILVHSSSSSSVESDSKTVSRGIGQRWAIADFGSASFHRPDRLQNDLIATRPYRAPEVIVGNGWSHPVDMWSLGCTLFEVFAGERLFPVMDDHVHLSVMNARLGPLPPCITRDSKQTKKFFDAHGNINRPIRINVKSLKEVCHGEPLLLDLLQRLLHYDPAKRIRTEEALQHPYFDQLRSRASQDQRGASPMPNPQGNLRRSASPRAAHRGEGHKNTAPSRVSPRVAPPQAVARRPPPQSQSPIAAERRTDATSPPTGAGGAGHCRSEAAASPSVSRTPCPSIPQSFSSRAKTALGYGARLDPCSLPAAGMSSNRNRPVPRRNPIC